MLVPSLLRPNSSPNPFPPSLLPAVLDRFSKSLEPSLSEEVVDSLASLAFSLSSYFMLNCDCFGFNAAAAGTSASLKKDFVASLESLHVALSELLACLASRCLSGSLHYSPLLHLLTTMCVKFDMPYSFSPPSPTVAGGVYLHCKGQAERSALCLFTVTSITWNLAQLSLRSGDSWEARNHLVRCISLPLYADPTRSFSPLARAFLKLRPDSAAPIVPLRWKAEAYKLATVTSTADSPFVYPENVVGKCLAAHLSSEHFGRDRRGGYGGFSTLVKAPNNQEGESVSCAELLGGDSNKSTLEQQEVEGMDLSFYKEINKAMAESGKFSFEKENNDSIWSDEVKEKVSDIARECLEVIGRWPFFCSLALGICLRFCKTLSFGRFFAILPIQPLRLTRCALRRFVCLYCINIR